MPGRNILLIGNYPPPFGGVPLHIERLTKYLQPRGWNCHVLSGGTTGRTSVDGVTVHKPSYARKLLSLVTPQASDPRLTWSEGRSLPIARSGWWRRYRLFADVGREIVRKNRIELIASYNLLTYAPIGAWLAREFGLPHLISNFGEVFKFDLIRDSAPFFRNIAESATQLLSCSEHCGRSLQLIGIETPVEAVTYGIDLDRFQPGTVPAGLRERLGLDFGPVILFVGRLGREMGLDTFVAAARRIAAARPDAQFLMVGQSEDLADEVAAICERPRSRMTLVRNAPYGDLPFYYRLADILLVPTRGDRTCSSLAGMEAMATRVPVIGFAIGGVPEIVADQATGLLVEPEDVEGLAEAALLLLRDDALRASLADAGFAQAKERLGEEHMNARMEAHFLAALGSP
jgi:glycosyltransferase involved in cell wall biosynthesis